jgi:hypothetical protein
VNSLAASGCVYATTRYKRVLTFDNRGEDLLGHVEASIAFIEQVLS